MFQLLPTFYPYDDQLSLIETQQRRSQCAHKAKRTQAVWGSVLDGAVGDSQQQPEAVEFDKQHKLGS